MTAEIAAHAVQSITLFSFRERLALMHLAIVSRVQMLVGKAESGAVPRNDGKRVVASLNGRRLDFCCQLLARR